MKQLIRALAIYLILVLSTTPGLLRAQAPPTLEEVLTADGVALTLPSLHDALRDLRSEVRGAAAVLLLSRKDQSAIVPIREALGRASETNERLNLARALLGFGDPAGNTAAREVCEQESSPEDLRLFAADMLFEAGDRSCTPSIVQLLSSTGNPGLRLYALEFLKRVAVIPANMMPVLQAGIERSLQDETAANRQAASDCVAFFDVSLAESALRRAVIVEQDRATRLKMQADLKQLQKAQHLRLRHSY